MIYDNWHTATCMNCQKWWQSQNLAKKSQIELLELHKHPVRIEGYVPDCWHHWHCHDIIGDSPNANRGVPHSMYSFKVSDIGTSSFINLFLMIPFNTQSIWTTYKSPLYLFLTFNTLIFFQLLVTSAKCFCK